MGSGRLARWGSNPAIDLERFLKCAPQCPAPAFGEEVPGFSYTDSYTDAYSHSHADADAHADPYAYAYAYDESVGVY